MFVMLFTHFQGDYSEPGLLLFEGVVNGSVVNPVVTIELLV